MSITSDSIALLNRDNFDEVLSNLGPDDLGRCCQVSKAWNRMVSEDKFWIQFVPEKFAKVDVKKYIDSHAITSLDGIADRFEVFASREVSLSGKFACLFAFNPDCIVLAELGYGRVDPKDVDAAGFRPAQSKEVCIFMKTLPNDDRGIFPSFYSDKERDAPGQSIFNISINPTSSYCKRLARLPACIQNNNLDLYSRIDTISGNQIDRLEIETAHRRHFYVLSAATLLVSVGGYALSKFFKS